MSNASIGKIGQAYYDSANGRTKAFFTTLLTSVQEVRECLGQAFDEMRGSRFCVRVLTRNVSEEQLCSIRYICRGQELSCEAVIPINKQGDCIAYYGWNKKNRHTKSEHRQQEMELLHRVTTRLGHHQHDYTGYTVEVAIAKHDWEPKDAQDLLEIYRRTFSGYLVEFTAQSIMDMLCSNWVSVVRSDEKIVAVAMAEIAHIESGVGDLRICELSEVATHPDFQRRGLSHLAFGQLLQALVESKIDVIFSETRAASYGMMAVAHDAGLVSCGRLEQHCVISSPYSEVSQDGVYGDLVVFALPPAR